MEPIRTVFLFFDGMEVLDFAGPLEVLGEAKDEAGRNRFDLSFARPGQDELIDVRNGLTVRAAHSIEAIETAGLLVIPGGRGVAELVEQIEVIQFIRRLAGTGAEVFSICTGSWLLAEAGLLNGQPATSHFLALDRLESRYPAVDWKRDTRYVFYEGGLTSAGVSAGIDAAFALLSRQFGEAYAQAQADMMEYRLIPGP